MTGNQTAASSSAEDGCSTKPGAAFRQECHQGRTTSSHLRNGGQEFLLDDGNLNYGREYALRHPSAFLFVPVSKHLTPPWVSCTILPHRVLRTPTHAVLRQL